MNENDVIDFKGIKLIVVPRLENCKDCYGNSTLDDDDMSLCDIVCPDDGSPLFESENNNRAITEDQYNKEQGWLHMDDAHIYINARNNLYLCSYSSSIV